MWMFGRDDDDRYRSLNSLQSSAPRQQTVAANKGASDKGTEAKEAAGCECDQSGNGGHGFFVLAEFLCRRVYVGCRLAETLVFAAV